jgi:hypothetical protein
MPSKRESSVVPSGVPSIIDDQPDSISLDQDLSQPVEEEGVSNSSICLKTFLLNA